MARRKAQNPYGSCLAARGRLAARQQRSSEAIAHQKTRDTALSKRMLFCGRFRHRALLSSGPSRSECADRSVSQLLAGTPSGPGGSSNAARVPSCEKARRRRTPSRLRNASRERPLEGRGVRMIRAVFGAGIVRGQRCHKSPLPLWEKAFRTGALKIARRPPHQGEGWSALRRSGKNDSQGSNFSGGFAPGGVIDRMKAMIFQSWSALLMVAPIGGIGACTVP